MTTTEDDPRMAKLPRWAQTRIEILERDLAHARERALQAEGVGPEDTDSVVEPYDSIPARLQPGARLRFYLDGTRHSYLDVRVTEQSRGKYVEVRGSGTVLIEPQSGNMFKIWSV